MDILSKIEMYVLTYITFNSMYKLQKFKTYSANDTDAPKVTNPAVESDEEKTAKVVIEENNTSADPDSDNEKSKKDEVTVEVKDGKENAEQAGDDEG